MDEISHREWLQWAREELLPAMMATGCFLDFKILRLVQPDCSPATTIAIQYELENVNRFNDFEVNFMGGIQKMAAQKWGDQLVSFSSLLETI